MPVHLPGRGPTPAHIYIYIPRGRGPTPAYIYISRGRGATPGYIDIYMYVLIYMHMPPVIYICVYVLRVRGRSPPILLSSGVYTECHGASFTLVWVGVPVHAMASGDPHENPTSFLVCIPFLRGKPCRGEGGWFMKFSAIKILMQEPGFCVHAEVQSSITHRCMYNIFIYSYICWGGPSAS